MNSSTAVASLLLQFPMNVFTTKRPNAFKPFRKMLRGFKTGEDEKKKKKKHI